MGIVFKFILKAGFISLLLIHSISTFAQADSIDSTIIEKGGRKFYTYVVEPGNTLYAISKKYNLSVKNIEKHNPGVKQGLSVGDTLYILAVTKDKKAKKMKMEVDGNVIVHEVQKGQTLYAISNIYDINTGDIIKANPGLKEGVKEGQLIKIPVAKLKKQEVAPVIKVEPKGRVHHVKSKETLYSLSILYRIPVEDIKKANNGLADGLKVGQVIIIPDVLSEIPVTLDSTEMKDEYNIAVILPFFLDINDTLHSSLKMDDKERVMSKSVVAIQFYEGCLMALDSLKKLGMNFNVKVYDSGKDSNIVKGLISNGDLSDVDLILGPFYQSQFKYVAQYAKQNKIHIVSPVPLSNKVLLGNPYVSKVATSQNILFTNLADYVSSYYFTENVVIITKHFRANRMAHSFKKAYTQGLFPGGDSLKYALKEIKWDNGSIDVIKSQLSDSAFNIIFIPSNDQVYVTEILSKLNLLKDDYLFRVIGVANWMKYSNLDLEYFENLHVTLPIDAYVNFDDKRTKRFIRGFYTRFEVFPENFSFLGFDVTFFFLTLLNEGGTRFEPKLEGRKEMFFYREFNFFKTGIESGFENSALRLLEYREFKLKEVNYTH